MPGPQSVSPGGGAAGEAQVPPDQVLSSCGVVQSSQLEALQHKYQKSLLLTLIHLLTLNKIISPQSVQILLLFNFKKYNLQSRGRPSPQSGMSRGRYSVKIAFQRKLE